MRHLSAKLLTDFYLAAGRNFATGSRTKTRTSWHARYCWFFE